MDPRDGVTCWVRILNGRPVVATHWAAEHVHAYVNGDLRTFPMKDWLALPPLDHHSIRSLHQLPKQAVG